MKGLFKKQPKSKSPDKLDMMIRKRRTVDRPLQIKSARNYLLVGALAATVQALTFYYFLNTFASAVPNDSTVVLNEVWPLILRGSLTGLAFVAPIVLMIGYYAPFRIIGPLFRFRTYLRVLAQGKNPGDCKIRNGDELQDLCELINRSTAPLRRQYAARDKAREEAARKAEEAKGTAA